MDRNIERLYEVFRKYQIRTALSEVGVYDFGPGESELEGISKPLRDIPCSALLSMEFYGSGWGSWGTEDEVKYFLPRILDMISSDVRHVETLFSLFKFKMANIFSTDTSWPKSEVVVLQDYFSDLLCDNLTKDIGYLIEALVVMGKPMQEIVEILERKGIDIRYETARNLLVHFEVNHVYDLPDALHIFDRPEELNEICNWAKVIVFEKL